MTHCKIFDWRRIFCEFYADTFSVWVTHIEGSQKIVLQNISDLDDVNIRPTKRQKTLVTDADLESEHETPSAGGCSSVSTKE